MEKLTGISEERAREILQRAAEIDRVRGEVVALQTLRNSAIEAGISAAAFDQAVSETGAASVQATSPISRRAAIAGVGVGLVGVLWAFMRRRVVERSAGVVEPRRMNSTPDTPMTRPDTVRVAATRR